MPRRAGLRSLLDAFEPHDALEQAHKRRIEALLDVPGDPFDRAHYTPGHITASAFVVDSMRRRLLLILHGKLGLWLQPGGHVDATDPDVLAAARREVLEETGLAVRPIADAGGGSVLDVDVHSIPARGDAPAHEHFDVRFVFEPTGATAAEAGSDARAVRWVELAAMLRGDPELPSDESVMRAVRKLRARCA